MFKRTAVLFCAFMLVFCMGAQAMTLSTPKQTYYSDIDFSSVNNDMENADFLYKLMALGILKNVDYDAEVTNDNLTDILKKSFNIKKLDLSDEITSNQQLIKVICDILKLQPADGIGGIKMHLDYGLISKEYVPYYQALAEEGYILRDNSLLRPTKPVTYLSLVNVLAGLENEIYKINGISEISSKVTQIAFDNSTKTVKTENDDEKYEVLLKKDRQTLYLKDGALSFSLDVSAGEYVNMLVNASNEVVYAESSNEKLEKMPNVEGIYKAKIYLYDYINGKMIFNELKKYNGTEFEDIDGKYAEFKVSDSALLYEYYRKTNGYYINRDFLDISAYFVVDTNEMGRKEIIYLNIVN